MNRWIKVPAEFEVVEVRRMDGENQQRVRVEIEYQGEMADDRDSRPGFWFWSSLRDHPRVGDVYELRKREIVIDGSGSYSRPMVAPGTTVVTWEAPEPQTGPNYSFQDQEFQDLDIPMTKVPRRNDGLDEDGP
jgi:hypothetical protein